MGLTKSAYGELPRTIKNRHGHISKTYCFAVSTSRHGARRPKSKHHAGSCGVLHGYRKQKTEGRNLHPCPNGLSDGHLTNLVCRERPAAPANLSVVTGAGVITRSDTVDGDVRGLRSAPASRQRSVGVSSRTNGNCCTLSLGIIREFTGFWGRLNRNNFSRYPLEMLVNGFSEVDEEHVRHGAR